jgi:hypothetical protein
VEEVDEMDEMTDAEQRDLVDAAYYMVEHGLKGMDTPPPASWTHEQIAAFDAIIATQSGRDALLAMALRGWQRTVLAARASAHE